MNSDDLVIFLSVAEEGSITKAAKRMGYVPSNVTARIQQLEMESETILFHRHSRGVTLTAPGKILVEYAQKVKQLLHNAKIAIQATDKPQGTLVIGSMETTAAVRLPKVLSLYHRRYPEVDLTLASGTTSYLVQEVLAYRLDGAFVNGPIENAELEYERVYQEELVLVSEPLEAIDRAGATGATDAIETSESTETSMRELMAKPILVFKSGCSYRAKLEQWLSSEGVVLPRIMEFGTLEAILGGVSAGLGVSLLPRSVIENLEGTGKLRSYTIPQNYATVDTLLIYRRDMVFGAAFGEFVRMVKSVHDEETTSLKA